MTTQWAFTVQKLDGKGESGPLKPPPPLAFDVRWECVACANSSLGMVFVWRTRSDDPTASLFERVFGRDVLR